MSLIGYPQAQVLDNALTSAAAVGKILIACAGNNGIGNADVSYPGASPETIAIGATQIDDQRAPFSGTGSALDFVAPGSGITTVRHDSFADTTSVVSGCSFATPITAGVVGLLLARAETLGISLDQQLVYDLLCAGADDMVGSPNEDISGRDDFFGHGRINALRSLQTLGTMQCGQGELRDAMGEPIPLLQIQGDDGSESLFRVKVPANTPTTFDVTSAAGARAFALLVSAGEPSGNPTPLGIGVGELCLDLPIAFFGFAGIAPVLGSVPTHAARLDC